MLGIFFSLCSENFEKAAYIEERQGVAFCFCFQISATHGVISQRPGLLNPNPAAGSMSFAQLCCRSSLLGRDLQCVREELPHSKIPRNL